MVGVVFLQSVIQDITGKRRLPPRGARAQAVAFDQPRDGRGGAKRAFHYGVTRKPEVVPAPVTTPAQAPAAPVRLGSISLDSVPRGARISLDGVPMKHWMLLDQRIQSRPDHTWTIGGQRAAEGGQ